MKIKLVAQQQPDEHVNRTRLPLAVKLGGDVELMEMKVKEASGPQTPDVENDLMNNQLWKIPLRNPGYARFRGKSQTNVHVVGFALLCINPHCLY